MLLAVTAAATALAPLLHHVLNRRHHFGLLWTLRLRLVFLRPDRVIALRLIFGGCCGCGITVIIIITQVEKAVLHPHGPGQRTKVVRHKVVLGKEFEDVRARAGQEGERRQVGTVRGQQNVSFGHELGLFEKGLVFKGDNGNVRDG